LPPLLQALDIALSELRIAAKHVAAEPDPERPTRGAARRNSGPEGEVILPARGTATRVRSPRPARKVDPSFESADLNGDGVVDREEWSRLQSRLQSSQSQSMLQQPEFPDDSLPIDWVGTEEEEAAVTLMNALAAGDEAAAAAGMASHAGRYDREHRLTFLGGVVCLLEEDDTRAKETMEAMETLARQERRRHVRGGSSGGHGGSGMGMELAVLRSMAQLRQVALRLARRHRAAITEAEGYVRRGGDRERSGARRSPGGLTREDLFMTQTTRLPREEEEREEPAEESHRRENVLRNPTLLPVPAEVPAVSLRRPAAGGPWRHRRRASGASEASGGEYFSCDEDQDKDHDKEEPHEPTEAGSDPEVPEAAEEEEEEQQQQEEEEGKAMAPEAATAGRRPLVGRRGSAGLIEAHIERLTGGGRQRRGAPPIVDKGEEERSCQRGRGGGGGKGVGDSAGDALFASWDKNGDGSLSHGEIKRRMKRDPTLAFLSQSPSFHWAELWAEYDPHGTGMVDKETFGRLYRLDIRPAIAYRHQLSIITIYGQYS